MKRAFWYNGHCSTEFGIVASGTGTFNGAERDVEKVAVLGRNGDLLRDNGRYKNTTVPYPIAIAHDFRSNSEAARAWLLSAAGYCKLEDAYNPDSYRMAAFLGPVDFDVQLLSSVGEAVLYFDCKPQRFLRSGDQRLSFVAPTMLHNPTSFTALPLIFVYGTGPGTVTVGNATVTIKSLDDLVILDCDLQNAYRQVGDGAPENKNGTIHAVPFPELLPGQNAISWTGAVEKIEIIPRWWTL